MELEFAASASLNAEQGYNLGIIESATPQRKTWIVDWEPLVRELLADVQARTAVPAMSARFHRGLAKAIIGIAQRLPVRQVVLSGGCFQNRVLTELTVKGLRDAGLAPYWHQRVPPNDGGICLGQIVAASRLSL
jgi:hydrogenase maturation protein HypF